MSLVVTTGRCLSQLCQLPQAHWSSLWICHTVGTSVNFLFNLIKQHVWLCHVIVTFGWLHFSITDFFCNYIFDLAHLKLFWEGSEVSLTYPKSLSSPPPRLLQQGRAGGQLSPLQHHCSRVTSCPHTCPSLCCKFLTQEYPAYPRLAAKLVSVLAHHLTPLCWVNITSLFQIYFLDSRIHTHSADLKIIYSNHAG
jgi:hypothetical protein